jgi:hypothetical protein
MVYDPDDYPETDNVDLTPYGEAGYDTRIGVLGTVLIFAAGMLALGAVSLFVGFALWLAERGPQ